MLSSFHRLERGVSSHKINAICPGRENPPWELPQVGEPRNWQTIARRLAVCFCKDIFTRTQPHPLFDVLSVAELSSGDRLYDPRSPINLLPGLLQKMFADGWERSSESSQKCSQEGKESDFNCFGTQRANNLLKTSHFLLSLHQPDGARNVCSRKRRGPDPALLSHCEWSGLSSPGLGVCTGGWDSVRFLL